MEVRIPKELKDCRKNDAIAFDARTADRYADRGTVMHFAFRLGFYPSDEEEAEDIINRLLLEREYLETWINLHYCGE